MSHDMKGYCHHVSGFFVRHEEAEAALSGLVARGLPRQRLQIFAADSAAPKTNSNEALKDVLIDGSIGAAVGTGISGALMAMNVSLFVASPLLAPLMMLGWGASLGGVVGGAVGATAGNGNKEGWLADLINDAITSGQVVLVAQTESEQETAIAREVIQTAIGHYTDTDAA